MSQTYINASALAHVLQESGYAIGDYQDRTDDEYGYVNLFGYQGEIVLRLDGLQFVGYDGSIFPTINWTDDNPLLTVLTQAEVHRHELH